MRNAVRYIYNRRHCCATARWKNLLFLLFARLIGNAARGLAGALAGSLALAAAAGLGALAEARLLKGLNVLHRVHLVRLLIGHIIHQPRGVRK